jgi:uncharacterized damage-inducible protein DinB
VKNKHALGELPRITDQLRRAFEGGAFHGPAVMEILRDVTAEQANRRPIPQAHTIWEITQHIAGWQTEIKNRLGGQHARTLPPEQNFPQRRDASEAAWRKTLEELEASYRDLSVAMAKFPESRLGDVVPGRDYNFYVLLHGIVQHDLYHAGQIALLKKSD